MKLQEDSGAKIDVVDKSAANSFQLSGSSESVARARELIMDAIGAVGQGQKVEEMIMEVPFEMIGHILGRGGKTIMKLQDDSGAKIDVDKVKLVELQKSSVDKTELVPVSLSGSSHRVLRARELILELIFEKPQAVSETMEVPEQMLGRLFGHGGGNIMSLQKESGAKININKANLVQLSGSADCVACARSLISKFMFAGDNEVEETMEVPPPLLGRIYGLRGQSIKELEDDSGAKIMVHAGQAWSRDGVKRGLVHLSGSAGCVNRARELISQRIAEPLPEAQQSSHMQARPSSYRPPPKPSQAPNLPPWQSDRDDD